MQDILSITRATFKNILFLTDFSFASDQALAYSLGMARHFEARLFPAHVADDAFMSLAASEEAISIGTTEEKKRDQWLRLVESNSNGYEPIVSRCDFQNAVRHWTTMYGIDLIIVGTQGRLQRSLLGPTAELALQHAFCPVLTIGPNVKVHRPFKLMLDKILFPAELGPQSGLGLPYALALASQWNAQLTLLHVLPEESCRYRDRSSILRFAMDELQKLLPGDANVFCKPEFAVDAGEAGEQIVRFASREQSDVIVMGLPPVFESAAQMRASVTYRVISSAACPVLTIRDKNAVSS
jgi:nucleotide-binding universal stress UspA family protein